MSQTAARLQPHPSCIAALRRLDAEADAILADRDSPVRLRTTAWTAKKSIRRQLRLLADTTTH